MRGKKKRAVCFWYTGCCRFCGVALPRSAGPPFSQSWTKAKKALSYRLYFQPCSLLVHISCTKMQCRKAQQCLHSVHRRCSSSREKGGFKKQLKQCKICRKAINRGWLKRQRQIETVVNYLWRGASQPSCTELGFVRHRVHPCLNMSAQLTKLLQLVSELLPRSCTALTCYETTPPSLLSFLTPHAQSLPPTVLWLGLSSLIYCFAQALFISCSIPILTEDILSAPPPPWNSAVVWGKGKIGQH